jgi:hypothetical protein
MDLDKFSEQIRSIEQRVARLKQLSRNPNFQRQLLASAFCETDRALERLKEAEGELHLLKKEG